MSDEQRERMLIAEQIERAAATAGSSEASPPPVEEGLKRDEDAERVVLSLAPKVPAAATSAPLATSGVIKLNPIKPTVNPLKAGVNPLKRTNVLKTAVPSTPANTDKDNEKKRAAPMTAAERLIFEEQERKRRRMERSVVAQAGRHHVGGGWTNEQGPRVDYSLHCTCNMGAEPFRAMGAYYTTARTTSSMPVTPSILAQHDSQDATEHAY